MRALRLLVVARSTSPLTALARRRSAAAVAGGLVSALAVAALVPATASAHPTPSTGSSGMATDSAGTTQPTSPTSNPEAEFSDSAGVQQVGHLPTDGGFNAGLAMHGRYAFLGSWGHLAGGQEAGGDGEGSCPSHGVRVVDLVDPRNPRLAATFADASTEPGLAGSWTEKVAVRDLDTAEFSGTVAAVSFQNCRPDGFRGFGVYDVTDPRNPQPLHLEATEDPEEVDGQAGSHEIWLDETDDGRAFVYTSELNRELRTAEDVEISADGAVTGGQPTDDPDFRIFEVTDPRNVTLVGQWGAWEELGVPPRLRDDNDVLRTNFVHSVITGTNAAGEPRAYLSYWDLGTVILDLSDRSDPTLVGRADFEADEAGDAHSAWLADDGERLVQTDETFVYSHSGEGEGPDPENVLEDAFGYARLVDLADESQPRQVATFELDSTRTPPDQLPPGFHTVHNPRIRPGDDQVYFSWYAEGAVVMPLPDDPEPGTVVDRPDAQFVPPPAEDPRGFLFPGEAFPNVYDVVPHEDHAGRPYAVASDVNSGLWVFRLGEHVPPGSCPEGQVADAEFDDVDEGSAHLDAISCAVHAGIARGVSEDPPRFSPGSEVTRGQMASLLARTLRAAGGELPDGDEPVFSDTDGSVHEPAITALARAGVVEGVTEDRFEPRASVRRDQIATFLVRAAEFGAGDTIEPVDRGHFDDVADGVHAAHVDAAFELDLVLGTGDGEFDPGSRTRRDQMASMVTRSLDQLEFVTREPPARDGNA